MTVCYFLKVESNPRDGFAQKNESKHHQSNFVIVLPCFVNFGGMFDEIVFKHLFMVCCSLLGVLSAYRIFAKIALNLFGPDVDIAGAVFTWLFF